MPLVELPLEPVSDGELPVVPELPVPELPDDEPPIEPLEPVSDDEPDDPVPDDEPPSEPDDPELPEEEPPIEPEDPDLLEEPFGMISICVTSAVEPEPEKLARTWSPSLMSESDAVWPFFVTCVLGLSFSWSESWLFFLSNFWTLPVTSLVPDEDAVEPIDDPEPVVSLDVEPPMDEPEPVVDPLEPVPP